MATNIRQLPDAFGKVQGNALSFDIGDIEQTIGDRFAEVCRQFPDRPAICVDGDTTTYGELNRYVNSIAFAVRDCGRPLDTGIAILLPQGKDHIAAILGVLNGGHFYVPLDPDLPESSLASMCEIAGIELILTQRRCEDLAARICHCESRLVDELPDDVPDFDPPIGCMPSSTAYIYFTSGSTGAPKGVYESHRNVLHNIYRYTSTLGIDDRDRLSLLQPPGFSGAVSSLFAALLNGAASFPFDYRNHSAAEFRTWLRNERISIYHSVPSVFRLLAKENETYPDVRMIRLEGDQASLRDVEIFRRHFDSACRLVNGLGATETGLASQYFIDQNTPLLQGTVPVGFSVPDVEISVLDADGRPVPGGDVGQIAVTSEYLAKGYWNDPERTAAAFRTASNDDGRRTYLTGDLGRFDANGALVHLGRMEGQVRLRGYTLQLSDIETAIIAMAGIEAAAVVVADGNSARERLVAYVVPTGQTDISVSAMRAQLADTLPGQAIPSQFVELASLPQNANGKIDRSALPPPQRCRPKLDSSFVAPRSLLQLQLAQIWERTIGIGEIGIHDDFFELGGHSLLALNMLLDVEKVFGVEIDGSSLLTASTIEQLEQLILRKDCQFKDTVVALKEGDGQTPFVFLHGDYNSGGLYCINLAKHLDDAIPFVVMSPLRMHESEREYSFEAMAEKYVARLRQIQPNGPYYLGGTCNGGMVAFEMARQLQAAGENVALLALFYATADNLRFNGLKSMVDRAGNLLRFSRRQISAVFFRVREIAQNISRLSGLGLLAYTFRKTTAIPATLKQLLRPPDNPLKERNQADNAYSHYRFLDAVYMPGRYEGSVSLIWPAGEDSTALEVAAWWRRVASSVDTIELDSDHYESLTTQVHQLGEVLSDLNSRTRASALPCPREQPRPSAE